MLDEKAYARRRLDDILFVASRVDRKKLAAEKDLLVTRWPDYAFMSPLEATQHFADIYVEVMRAFRRSQLDKRLAENVAPVDLRRPKTSSKLLHQFWSARQKADAVGARYQEYINFSFDFACRRGRRKAGGRRYLPQPNQLGPAEKNTRSAAAWHTLWKPHWHGCLECYMVKPTHQPQFAVDTYVGLPAQLAFRACVLDQAGRGNKDFARLLFELCVDRRCIPIRALIPLLGRSRFVHQISRLRDLREYREFRPADRNEHIAPARLWQSCLGHPGVRSEVSPVCLACPQSSTCAALTERIETAVATTHNVIDPYRDRERRMSAARQRRRRDRLREQATIVPEQPVAP